MKKTNKYLIILSLVSILSLINIKDNTVKADTNTRYIQRITRNLDSSTKAKYFDCHENGKAQAVQIGNCTGEGYKKICEIYKNGQYKGKIYANDLTGETQSASALQECNYNRNVGENRNIEALTSADTIEFKLGELNCGSTLYVTSCESGSNEDKMCYLKKSASDLEIYAKVNAGLLTPSKPNCSINNNSNNNSNNNNSNTNTKKEVNAARWVIKNFFNNSFKCGEAIYITSCENGICNYAYLDNTNKIIDTISEFDLTDKIKTVESECYEKGLRYPIKAGSVNGKSYKCGEGLYITECFNDTCYIAGIGDKDKTVTGTEYIGIIDRNLLRTDQTNALYSCNSNNSEENEDYLEDEEEFYQDEEEIIDEEIVEDEEDTSEDEDTNNKTCNNEIKKDQKGESIYELCFPNDLPYNKFDEEVAKYFTCADGYKFDTTYFDPLDDEEKFDSEGNYLKRTFNVKCTSEVAGKPVINIHSSKVTVNPVTDMGTVSFEAKAMQGDIVAYYFSETFKSPTHLSKGWVKSGEKFEITTISPGTLFVWVKDSLGGISNAVRVQIADPNNPKTTLTKIELYDGNGNIQSLRNKTAYNNTIKSNKYVMMSNDLRNDSKVLADGFNPFSMEYELEVDSPTITVYATLTSSDSSYVPGYEPRTVNLDYGINTVLIKIKDNEGKVRTYTILVTRKDNRTSDNTLRDIKLSVGKLEFNSNVTDYKIEIPNNTTSVNVDSTITSDKASYVPGYEPGIVNITGETTVKLIKVKSETGSTRTYILTFVKKSTDIITDESLMLDALTIPGVYIPFESNVANYSVSVDYETAFIDVNPVLKDKTSKMKFSTKRKSETEFKIGSPNGVLLDVGENFVELVVRNKKGETSTYRITIIRKEMGLGISDDVTLKDLRVLNYDIKFKPEKKDYTVKIKQEKSLVITAVPNSNRAEVFIRGNEELTGFSTVRIKVVAENGEYETYSIDIKKDAFNKPLEIAAIVVCTTLVIVGSVVLYIKKKNKVQKAYFEE